MFLKLIEEAPVTALVSSVLQPITPEKISQLSPLSATSPTAFYNIQHQVPQPQENTVQRYHEASRLHQLTQFKLNAQEFLIKNPPYGPKPTDTARPLYMHVDIDCFFCQASFLKLPASK